MDEEFTVPDGVVDKIQYDWEMYMCREWERLAFVAVWNAYRDGSD